MAGNPCGKRVARENAYEVWTDGAGWTWYVLKKYQSDDDRPYARWMCDVVSPYTPKGERGDVYVAEVKRSAYRVN